MARHSSFRWTVLLLALPWSLAAQVVRGRIVDAGHTPLLGALVELRDSAGHSLGTALTSATGAFGFVAPRPGVYQYRVAAIGYRPRPPTAITVPDSGVVLPDVTLDRMIVHLPDIIAAGRGKYCGRSGLADDRYSRFLESAHTALEIIQKTIEGGQVGFQVAVVTTRTIFGGINNVEVADTSFQPLSKWPVQSIDPDTLRVVGFSRLLDPGDENTRWYYGPDPRVLFSDWFLESHCFTLDQPNRKRGVDTLRLRFAPARKSALVDIAGELVLDAHDLSLLQFSFTMKNLPKWMPEDAAGGNMDFARMGGGLWITRSWAMWAPSAGVSMIDRRISVSGQLETHGWVVRVTGRNAAPTGPE